MLCMCVQGLLSEDIPKTYRAGVKVLNLDFWAVLHSSTGSCGNAGARRVSLPIQSALRLKPMFTDAYNNMASALVQKGLIPAALQCYNTALACDPNLVSLDVTLEYDNVSDTGGPM